MIDNILDELFSLRTGKRRENIDDLKLIYDLLGKPCNSVKVIHIAGTNGKAPLLHSLKIFFWKQDIM